jgi:hypothetical protein
VSLENVDIENFSQQCVNFQPSVKMNLVMYNTNLENCGGNALIVNNSSGVGFSRANIEKSTIHRSAIGVQALNSSDVSIHNSMISNNITGGVSSEAGTTVVTVDLSVINNNGGYGVHVQGGGLMRVSNNSISLNGGIGMDSAGGTIVSWCNNWVDANTGGNGSHTGGCFTPL